MSSLLITGVILWYTEVQRSAVSMAACHVSTTHSPLTVASIRSMATRGTTASKMYLRPHLPSSPTEQQLATVKLLGMKTLAPEKSHNFYRKFLRMLLMPLKGRLAPSRHKHTHTCLVCKCSSIKMENVPVNAVLVIFAVCSLLIIC